MCFKTFDTINSLSGIQYAYNLKVLIISDIAIEKFRFSKYAGKS